MNYSWRDADGEHHAGQWRLLNAWISGKVTSHTPVRRDGAPEQPVAKLEEFAGAETFIGDMRVQFAQKGVFANQWRFGFLVIAWMLMWLLCGLALTSLKDHASYAVVAAFPLIVLAAALFLWTRLESEQKYSRIHHLVMIPYLNLAAAPLLFADLCPPRTTGRRVLLTAWLAGCWLAVNAGMLCVLFIPSMPPHNLLAAILYLAAAAGWLGFTLPLLPGLKKRRLTVLERIARDPLPETPAKKTPPRSKALHRQRIWRESIPCLLLVPAILAWLLPVKAVDMLRWNAMRAEAAAAGLRIDWRDYPAPPVGDPAYAYDLILASRCRCGDSSCPEIHYMPEPDAEYLARQQQRIDLLRPAFSATPQLAPGPLLDHSELRRLINRIAQIDADSACLSEDPQRLRQSLQLIEQLAEYDRQGALGCLEIDRSEAQLLSRLLPWATDAELAARAVRLAEREADLPAYLLRRNAMQLADNMRQWHALEWFCRNALVWQAVSRDLKPQFPDAFLTSGIHPRSDQRVYLIRSARLRITACVVAAERYRRRHGALPESAAELVPEFLAAVPLSPLSGRPVICRFRNDTADYAICFDDGDDWQNRFTIVLAQ